MFGTFNELSPLGLTLQERALSEAGLKQQKYTMYRKQRSKDALCEFNV